MSFLYCYIMSTGLLPLSHEWFCTITHHLENTDSLSHADVDTFHHINQYHHQSQKNLNTVVPWYSSFCSRIHDECWNWLVLTMKHFLLVGSVAHTSWRRMLKHFSGKCGQYRVWCAWSWCILRYQCIGKMSSTWCWSKFSKILSFAWMLDHWPCSINCPWSERLIYFPEIICHVVRFWSCNLLQVKMVQSIQPAIQLHNCFSSRYTPTVLSACCHCHNMAVFPRVKILYNWFVFLLRHSEWSWQYFCCEQGSEERPPLLAGAAVMAPANMATAYLLDPLALRHSGLPGIYRAHLRNTAFDITPAVSSVYGHYFSGIKSQ